jgi:hypothetical protein
MILFPERLSRYGQLAVAEQTAWCVGRTNWLEIPKAPSVTIRYLCPRSFFYWGLLWPANTFINLMPLLVKAVALEPHSLLHTATLHLVLRRQVEKKTMN